MSAISIRLVVYVTADGDPYDNDTSDLADHVEGWIQSALDDRDGIDAYGPGLQIDREDCPQP